MSKIFEKFTLLYLRITLAISRAQEYSADKVAVTTQGAAALIDCLKKLNHDGLAFNSYLNREFIPLLEKNYRPPFGEGFQLYLTSQHIRHAESLDAPTVTEDPRLAVELLRNIPTLETSLFEDRTNDAEIQPIGWDQYLEAYLSISTPLWQESQAILYTYLNQPTPLTLPHSTAEIRQFAAQAFAHTPIDTSKIHDHELNQWASDLCSQALRAMLLDHGYNAFTRPGDPFLFHKDDGPMIQFDVSNRQTPSQPPRCKPPNPLSPPRKSTQSTNARTVEPSETGAERVGCSSPTRIVGTRRFKPPNPLPTTTFQTAQSPLTTTFQTAQSPPNHHISNRPIPSQPPHFKPPNPSHHPIPTTKPQTT